MTTTPAGHEPHNPARGEEQPQQTGATPRIELTRTHKVLIGLVVAGTAVLAAIGFAGSYSSVTDLAAQKGFGDFAKFFTIGVDSGIGVLLALDLLLTWIRIPFPLLRQTAWLLTAATIAFNAAAAWPDPLGVAMHAVIPILFVISVEAARHAIGRIADITADKHIESPPFSRWLLNPISTFILWRRMRLWGIRKWDTVLKLERERRIYIGKLRRDHGRWAWRRKATADQMLVLSLARDGMSISEAIELPAREEEKRRQEQDRIAREQQQAADERRRKAVEYEREQQRLEDERLRRIEDDRIEQERKALELEKARQEAERQRQIADAEAKAQLDGIARRQQEERAEADRRRRQEEVEHARRLTEEQQKAAAAAKARQAAEEEARREAERKLDASRRAAEVMQRAANASASQPATSRAPANGSATASASATGQAEAASPASAKVPANGANRASASGSQTAASGASAVDISQVVDVYQLLMQQEGKAPSDAQLGNALGVSRSRAQQLRTAAIDAGHTELAKPIRLAS